MSNFVHHAVSRTGFTTTICSPVRGYHKLSLDCSRIGGTGHSGVGGIVGDHRGVVVVAYAVLFK